MTFVRGAIAPLQPDRLRRSTPSGCEHTEKTEKWGTDLDPAVSKRLAEMVGGDSTVRRWAAPAETAA
jgi:hypothetical protein